jgi:hypothetical protein
MCSYVSILCVVEYVVPFDFSLNTISRKIKLNYCILNIINHVMFEIYNVRTLLQKKILKII